MRGAVSPLRVTLILTVPHLHLKRVRIWSLSSHTGNTSTYIPASSTLLILLWCLRFSRYIYTMIYVAALCHTSSSPLLKLNTAVTYKIGTKALSAILDAMKLIRSPPVDSCSEYDPNDYSNLEESKADGNDLQNVEWRQCFWRRFCGKLLELPPLPISMDKAFIEPVFTNNVSLSISSLQTLLYIFG